MLTDPFRWRPAEWDTSASRMCALRQEGGTSGGSHGGEAMGSAPEVPLPQNSVGVRSAATALDVYAPGRLGELTEIIDP